MINIKITARNKTEDYIAVEREVGAIVLPSKHVFGIFSVGIISVLLALPFGQLIPIEASPFSALSASRLEENRKLEQDYLKNNETDSEQNLEIASTAGSQENYDDDVIPEALLATGETDNKDLSSEDVLASHIPSLNRARFGQNGITALDKDSKIIVPDNVAHIKETQEQQNARQDEYLKHEGKWYTQTVRKGDSLYKIFNYLNLDTNELKKMVAVAKKGDINLTVGTKLQFLIDKKNEIQELAIPMADNRQVRFLRDDQNNTYIVSREDLFAQFDNNAATKDITESTAMPSYVEAQKKREQAQKEKEEQLALKNKEEREKALLAQKQAEENQRVIDNLTPKVDFANRPRLIIGSINAKENFDKAAKRLGLSRSEIASIKKQYQGKINFRRLSKGDSFRVLFNGIGPNVSMTAVVFDTKRYGTITLYRNAQNHLFYEEGEYKPAAGAFRRFPITGQIKVNSPFNPKRYHPILRKVRPHYGVDFKLKIGTPVYAPADGVVTYASYMRGGGYTVIISHKGGYRTVYMHLSKYDVRKGQQVRIGQVIAKSGNTGYSTGPHLHYEVHVNGRAVDPLKVDLPSGSPEVAQKLRKSFEETVYILKTELYKNALAYN